MNHMCPKNCRLDIHIIQFLMYKELEHQEITDREMFL